MALISTMALLLSADAGGGAAAPQPLSTRWAGQVDPVLPWPEYPRPNMVREQWLNLNGPWDYAIRPAGMLPPGSYDGKILVPFPLESLLSGVTKRLLPAEALHYRRTFTVPQAWQGQRILLHFEAVDWQAVVRVNGKVLAEHQGGYDPFSVDITDALSENGLQELVVSVWDPSDTASQPRGKQVLNPGGIWYTPTSGIWQTVWLEPVPVYHIASYTVVPDVAGQQVSLAVNVAGTSSTLACRVRVLDGGKAIAGAQGGSNGPIVVAIPDPVLWSPANPHLYQLELELWNESAQLDAVEGYFGMRDVRMGQDSAGHTRIMLNGKPEFMNGPLDQGFWPDGLYTPPTDEALKYDIEITKELGFNMLRKHVKVEPRRFYYWCDKLGIWVWQDMPSGFTSGTSADEQTRPTAEVAQQFDLELARMVREHFNHPSIVVWVPFNESWGQHDTERVTQLVRSLDPSRLVNSASGWVDFGTGDMQDIHHYPEPEVPVQQGARALVLGEFGGLGHRVDGHIWTGQEWGYATPGSVEELLAKYREFYTEVWRLARESGMSACVYTQTTDVEIEANGLLTYDRAVIKMDADEVREINAQRPVIE